LLLSRFRSRTLSVSLVFFGCCFFAWLRSCRAPMS